jgi:transposase InsO family protein
MNAHCERVIGTLRRDCTDHLIVLNAAHAERLLAQYVAWYNASRTHMALDGNAPWPRAREPTPVEHVTATSVLGGLHHAYRKAS